MPKVFVYHTLKRQKILETALGERHGKTMTRATAPGFIESAVFHGKQTWPSLYAVGRGGSVQGDIIDVDDSEMARLRHWEDHYEPKMIDTSAGPAYAFFFRPPSQKRETGSEEN